jgi:hypothetical protein
MNKTNRNNPNSHPSLKYFEIRVKGQLNKQWSDWLEGMEVKLLNNGDMLLFGPVIDQAALIGIINKLSYLNLTLLSVNEIKKRKEEKMNTTKTLNRNFEAIAWGALFIWWGITELVNFLPEGTGAIGVGLILLGLNAARRLNGVATSSFTITLGILALVMGGLELTGAVLSLPFELPVFAILMIVLGVIVLARELTGNRN